VIRSKWHKNQKCGAGPTASSPRAVIQMDTVTFSGVFAFTGIDIYTKKAEVMLRPGLTSENGAAFLRAAMPTALRDVSPCCNLIAARSSRAPLPSKPVPIVSDIALPARTRRTNRPTLKASTSRYTRNAWAGGPIEPRTSCD
jgi:hypothetical protein